MSIATQDPNDPITVTDSAVAKIHELMQEEDNLALKLRIFITGGGCSGFQYGFSFEETANEDDTLVTKSVVSLLIDPLSLPYLLGAEVDYRKDINGERFIIRNNPNAKTSCGCGSSFAAN